MSTQSPYSALYKLIGYTFHDENLFTQALTHRSAARVHNERLEFLGDAVLGMVVAQLLYDTFKDVPEGKLTRMRATLVKGETLAEIGTQLGLGQFIKLGSGERKSGGHRRGSILADAVEAIIGAIYHEAGFETALGVVKELFASRISQLNPDAHPKDNKTRLQELLQSRKSPLPEYAVVSINGQDHAQTFVVSCSVINQETPTQGRANSRRKAEQEAAKLMLERLTNG